MELDALYKLTHGLYILGAEDSGRPVGSVVDAVMQVANKPVVIALSCNNQSYTKECIERTGVFGLSVLCKDVDPFVIANFGFQSSRSIDKWENVDYCIRDGVPYLNDNIATVRCKVLQSIKYDSNTLFIAEVRAPGPATPEASGFCPERRAVSFCSGGRPENRAFAERGQRP